MHDDNPHSRSLRHGRYSEPGRIYFITSSSERRARIFEKSEHAIVLLKECKLQQEKGDCESLAIVVMPDHFHWLLRLGKGRTLQQIVGSMKGRSAKRINELRSNQGQIWQAGFHDHAIRRDEDLEAAATYLIHNPVRAGIVDNFHEYPFWSSIWHDRNCRKAFRPETSRG